MAYPTDVKIFWCDPDMTSVPSLISGTGGRGSLVNVFDACLVYGYGEKTASSVVVQNGIATVTFPGVHEFGQWQVVNVSGALYAPLNGEKRVLTADRINGTITFDAEGIPDGEDTGVVKIKVAPLGWLKPFSGDNKGVYKINTEKYPEASNQYLQVDDSVYTYVARVFGYENMQSVDKGTNSFGGYYIPRGETTNNEKRYWVLIGDGRCFYFLNHWYSGNSSSSYGCHVYFFGDPITPDESDPYKFIVTGGIPGDSSYSPHGSYSFPRSDYPKRCRGSNRVTGNVDVEFTGPLSANPYSGYDRDTRGFPFPNLQDGTIQLNKIHIREGSLDYSYLGTAPGYLYVENKIGSRIHRSRFMRIYDTNSAAFPNRVIGYFLTMHNSSNNTGVVAFDIIGPWR